MNECMNEQLGDPVAKLSGKCSGPPKTSFFSKTLRMSTKAYKVNKKLLGCGLMDPLNFE